MAEIVTVTLVCDRCGSTHDKAKLMDGNQWAQATVQWSGDVGGRTYDGTAAGCLIKGKAWLCMNCTEAFLVFMKPATAQKEMRLP